MTDPLLRAQLLPQEKPPKDRYNVAYIVFFIMGAGLLFSWNSFITAADYFGYLYPGAHIDRTFSLAYILAQFTAIILVINYGRRFSPAARITTGFTVFFVILLVIPLLDVAFIRDDKGTFSTLAVTVGLVVIAGTMDALEQGSLFGVAGELPEVYTQAITAGTGASGFIVSLLRCITKAALPRTRPGVRESAVLYFLIGAAFIAGVLASYRLLRQLPIIHYYERRKREREGEAQSILHLENGQSPVRCQRWEPNAGPPSLKNSPASPLQRDLSFDAYLSAPGSPHSPPSPPVLVELDSPQTAVTFWQVFRKIWLFAVMMLLVFLVTLSIFPGFLSEDVHSGLLGDWYPVLLITTYNTFDLVGKMLPLFFVVRNDKVIVSCVLLRALFFPAFLLCLHGPAAMGAEWVVFTLTAMLGATNGYFTGVLMMLAPKRVDPHEAETAGTVMVLFLASGLAAGALGGWLWLL
ncbi:Nucleoside transporter family protein [Klebsormidium nitens]|uniref:Nucleoside transporter family protein n=1 Tax=Klebsormidium nitens TaxID=105231 RepID=A0A0U9I664_KLENI|nr:Nucleoside transporter family protein [Klebsormidium nitens]|eukprot:GAQ77564.1 Nucleoside transporter family protein [Klebsormidium nitens]